MSDSVSGIYRIALATDGRCYVGSSARMPSRWRGHRSALRRGCHHSPHLQAAWNKYGEAAFEFEILEPCPVALLLEREQWWIDHLHAVFNVLPVAGSSRGHRLSAEHRERISAAHRGKSKSPEHVEQMRERMIGNALSVGRVVSAETRAKVSAALKGKPKSPEARAKMRQSATNRWVGRENPARGRPVTAEARAKQSAAMKGRRLTPEHRAKISAALAGRPKPKSPETRAKISASVTRYYAERKRFP